ncbi:MAG TPA: protein-methionine-sulfoxide reductase catalytic subunit MsrP, partial [Thermoanaerobaculia bacterium]|nr:protein-methionine-sulfoxide reductase catalytic subunit MsrP [Thermoanaerobaculia bacterium]
MPIHIPKPWQIPEREATPESAYFSRRSFLAALGIGAIAACSSRDEEEAKIAATLPKAAAPYPVKRNARYVLDRPLSNEINAARYNNFYEFTADKDVWKRTAAFHVEPWTVEVTGLVAKPLKYSLNELLRAMPLEERLYRHRCVEAWAMTVPWSGFPLATLLRLAEPKHEARFVRFVSAQNAAEQPGVRAQPWYPWPYYEGLRIDEAMNELTFAVTGVYGHALPKQHGAPLRIAVPWKYGYKSAKSVVRIELVAEQPHSF